MDRTKTYADILEIERRCAESIGERPTLEEVKVSISKLLESAVELAYYLGRYELAQERLAETADKESPQ